MSKSELIKVKALPVAELRDVVVALGKLVDAWDGDMQDLFEASVSNGMEWNIPSLDECHAELLNLFTIVNAVNTTGTYARPVA